MDSLRQFGTGIALAVISVILILGGFTLATVEGKAVTSAAPTATFVLVIPAGLPTLSNLQPTQINTALPLASATLTQIPDLLDFTSTPNPAATSITFPTVNPLPTLPPLFPVYASPTTSFYYPTVTNCSIPFGYSAITVKLYDTVSSLALYYKMSVTSLMQINCLSSEQLQVGEVLYVLPRPVTTYSTAVTQCGAPYGWINYYVVSGDTLYNISIRYRTTVAQLKSANCLGSSDYIQVGQVLKVPNVATTAPQATSTGYPTTHPSSTPSANLTPIPSMTVPPTTAPTAVSPASLTPSSNAGPASSETPGP